jgi:hypothetical protein
VFANGNTIIGAGAADNGYKLEVSGNLYVNSIVNATTDTDRFIVSDGGVIKYRTGAEVLSDIGGQSSLTLTTTGTTGPATLIGSTLNIPQYQGGVTSFNTRTGAVTLTSSDVTTALGYTPVTDLRTLTINGETYNLTANRSWTIGVNPSAREVQTYIATASQTTFTVTGGYTVGLLDVFINGVRLTSSDFTATNGTTVVLAVGTMAGNIVDIIKYTSGFTNAVSGSGTTNELAYFTGSTVIASLSTATYPSLTELSYVKGVTSSIQTQLNGKQASGNYVTLDTTQTITSQKTFTTSGSSDTMIISHGSGSGFALDVIKAGNNEALRVTKTSGSGNAMTVIGGNFEAPTIVKTGGTSTQYLMANGSVSTLTNPVTGTGTTNYLPKFTGTSTIGNSLLTDNGTTLAYGNNIISVGASNTSEKYLEFGSSNGAYYVGGTSSEHYIFGQGDKPLRLYTNGTVKATLTSGGNLLVGTTTDAGQRLQVNGRSTFTSVSGETINATGVGNEWVQRNVGSLTTGQSYGMTINAGTNSSDVSFNVSNAANTINYFRVRGDGNVGIGTASPANLLHLTGAVATPSLRLGSTSLSFYWDIGRENLTTGDFVFNNASGGASTERMRITSGGNVLIGTTTNANFGANRTTIQINGADGSGVLTNYNNTAAFYVFSSSAGTDLVEARNLYMSFATNGSERARITSGGNVLIGTTTDSGNRLDVNGSARINGLLTSGSSTSNGDFRIISNSNPFLIQGRDIYNRGFLALSWDIGPDAGIMFGNTLGFNVNSNPGVTVGTRALTLATSGAATFSSSLRATEITAAMPSGNGALYINNSSLSNKNWTFIPQTSSSETDLLLFYTGASAGTRLTVTNGGNVGIGTASPAAELQVNKSSDVGIAMSNSSSVTSGPRGSLSWYNSSVSTVALIRAAAVTDNVGTELQFYTRPAAGSLTQVLTITSGGNVLIGTTTDDGSRLRVNGNGRFTNNAQGSASVSTSNANSTDDAAMSNLNFDGNRLRLGVLSSDSTYGCIGTNGANTGLAFVTNNATGWGERMRITSGGRVGIRNTSPQGLLEVGVVDNNNQYGGHFFSTFQIPQNVWSTVFYAPNNSWAAITEFTWTSATDYNRSGSAYMRWAYNAGANALGVVWTLFNDSQNSTATFRQSGGEIQVLITGGVADYYVQVRIQGSKAA